jgi:dipeptidase D
MSDHTAPTTTTTTTTNGAAVLAGLLPAPVWRHFEALTQIPRPSGHEARVRAHVVAFAHARGLPVIVDDTGNVIVKKPASPGMADRPGVILQGHLDMVPQKATDSTHDFTTDPIRPRLVDGGLVKATGTTLGADNGIGVATALAILESDLPHPPLEVLFTIDEEAGMTGARGLKPGILDGEILLNLDSEDEGELCIGCAGGADFKAHRTFSTSSPAGSHVALRVDVSGLRGGHSGVDIHLGRANANVLLARLLDAAGSVAPLRLARIAGGTLRNAIPRSASAVVVVDATVVGAVRTAIDELGAIIRREYRDADPDLAVAIVDDVTPAAVLDEGDSARVIQALLACPHGVFAMVKDMPEVTETSNNLAIVTLDGGRLDVTCMLRSSVDSKKAAVGRVLTSVFALLGAETRVEKGYPGWQPDTRSPTLALLRGLYEEKFGTKAKVTATHGGLECGLICATYPHLDAVSLGPTIRFPHSPDEQVDIASVQRCWDFLVDVLARIPAR